MQTDIQTEVVEQKFSTIDDEIVVKIGKKLCDRMHGRLYVSDFCKVVIDGLDFVTSYAPYVSINEKAEYMKRIMRYVIANTNTKGLPDVVFDPCFDKIISGVLDYLLETASVDTSFIKEKKLPVYSPGEPSFFSEWGSAIIEEIGVDINFYDIGKILKLASCCTGNLYLPLSRRADIVSKVACYVIDHTDTRYLLDVVSDNVMKLIIKNFVMLFIEY